MPYIILECKACGRLFTSGIYLAPGASVALNDNLSQCPFCGSIENIPNGNFQATVDGFKNILKDSQNPLKDARVILEGLKQAEKTGDLSKIPYGQRIEVFLEKNKTKIAFGIAIIEIMINLLAKQPNININNNDIDQQIIIQINQTVNIKADDGRERVSSI